eukprot:CCRYP_006576-RA/>CCRYP_006576-RA protein AED:0.30 eAED:0.30 QI:378/0.5/0.66/1/0/0.33/3/51/660
MRVTLGCNPLLSLILLASAAEGKTPVPLLGFVRLSPFHSSMDPSIKRHPSFPLSMSRSSKARQKLRLQQKLRRKQSHRTPSHHLSTEVAGVTSGIGLWKEFRKRLKNHRRRSIKETFDESKLTQFLLKSEGRRRKKLKERLKKLGYNFSSSSTRRGGAVTSERSQNQIQMEEDDENCDLGLDAMRARAGVLRTRIRLKQDELKELEVLMQDVVREMRLERFMKKEKPRERQPNFESDKGFALEDKATNAKNGLLEINGLMNEFHLEVLNNQWKDQSCFTDLSVENEMKEDDMDDDELMYEFQLDLMKKRSAEIQSIILLDRINLQRLERRILCCESSELGILERAVGNTLDTLNEVDFLETNPVTVLRRQARKFANTFGESSSVLLRKLDRVSSKSGQDERNFESLKDFVVKETSAGIRIVGNLLSNPSQLTQLIDPETPTLIPHVPAILVRLDRLESHVAPILSRVLNNKQHLKTIEPYLPEILERFDDIEPHLPWILDNVDVLAPYTGLLLKHIDELLLYAAVDEYEAREGSKDNYAFAEQLLPYLEIYVSQLDLVGPHLPLLRPHLPLLLKHNRIKILSPHVGKLFAKGYQDLSASANMDILLFYFGWALRIPFVPYIFFSLPGSPRTVSFLANRLPKRLVRGRCSDAYWMTFQTGI